MKEKDLEKGDGVTWDASEGKIEGTVDRKVTKTTKIKGHIARATKDAPQFIVTSDKTGAEAAHHPDELTKKKGG